MGALAACCAGAGLWSLKEKKQTRGAIFADATTRKMAKLYAWGAGLQGQLGVGTELMAQPLPREVLEIKDTRLAFITAANDLSAAIDDKGKVYTWGKAKGMMAQEKHGFTSNLLVPALLPFKEVENEVFTQVACGRTHMAAVTNDGKL